MLNFKTLELIMKDLEKNNLFNEFLMNLLDYNKEELSKLIVRYKFDNGFILDIFDYNIDKKFIRYYFTFYDCKQLLEENVIVNVININDYYDNFDEDNKFSLFSSLFYLTDDKKNYDLISKLFDEKIIKIIKKHIS